MTRNWIQPAVPLWLLMALVVHWIASPAPAQEKQPAEATEEAQPTESEDPPAPRRGGGKILLPGGGSYGAQPSGKAVPPASEGSSAPIPPAPVPPPTPGPASTPSAPAAATTGPAAPAAKTTGDLFWSGRIYKNGRIRIKVGNETTAGYVEGDPLPGVPVTVDARSPIVEIIEQPSARNGYKSFEFRVKKTRKEPVSFNFHWVLKP